MALRQVARERILAQLSKRNYTSQLTRAELRDLDKEEHVLTFGPGITVLCGGNGAGKSRTLGALARCLGDGDEEDRQRHIPELPHWLSSISVTGSTAGAEWTVDYDRSKRLRSGEGPSSVVYIDPSAETEGLIRLFSGDDNREDLKEGVDPAPLLAEDVRRVGHILRRSYAAIEVYEVTAFSEDDNPTPYFVVEAHSQTYDLLGMGRGELVVTYLLWRLRNLEPGTVVLLEEPESHLASFSQRALTDALAAFAVEQDLTMVVSSHSPGIINPLPDGNVTLLKGPPEQGFRHDLGIQAISDFLGIRASSCAVVIVEDAAAQQVLRAVIEAAAPDLSGAVTIRYARSGESGVHRLLDEIRSAGPDRFAVIGVLDGDQRGSADLAQFGYLPGSEAPEIVLRAATDRWRADSSSSWSPPLAGGAERLRMLLESTAGHDHHDWLAELGKHYGNTTQVVRAFVELLLTDHLHKSEADQLIDWLKEKCRQGTT
ncbi:ATP-dependent nuclease [Amycolatopsis nivea]|uniref:ATP-dependent nuclease n=1 Tax=Amycolatopsis nivea TaxID=1644109 RepID=UPI00106F20AA|nr:AAA family ATPase [Amycolatopsis nivea]